MKKTLRTILAGAVALLAVSCYDDSEVMKGLKDLDERLTAVETTLNAEVGGIQDIVSRLSAVEGALNAEQTGILARLDAIDGAADGKIKDLEAAIDALEAADKAFDAELAETLAKIAITKVEQVNGSWVLTPASGDPITLSKSGLVTITKVGDKDYWATVGEDGQAVSTGVPVAHPDYTFSFTVENGELKYAVNGGDAVGTGVTTGDLTGQDYLIGDVEVAEDGKSVTIIIGEAEYVLPIYIAEKGNVVSIKAGKQYFDYGEAKEVGVFLENISDLVVMTKPDGWKANLNGATLTVTAPSQTKVESGDADAEGMVVLHGNSADGKCKIATLTVSTVKTNGVFALSIDAEGVVHFKNSKLFVEVTWQGDVFTSFASAKVGICPIETFNSYGSFAEFYEAYEAESVSPSTSYFNMRTATSEYEVGVYEEDVWSISIADFAKACWDDVNNTYYSLKEGEQYVVWAVPEVDELYAVEEAAYAYYEPIYMDYTMDVSWNSATLTFDAFSGAEQFYFGFESAPIPDDDTFKTYMTSPGDPMPGPWYQFTSGYMDGMGEPVKAGEVRELQDLSPNTVYYAWVFPYNSSKPNAKYDYDTDFAPYIIKIKTSALEEAAEGEVTAPEVEKVESWYSICAGFTPSEGATIYYKWATAEEWDGGKVTVDAILEDCWSPVVPEDGPQELKPASYQLTVEPGKTYYLAMLVVKDGKYVLHSEEFETPELPIDKNVSASLESLTKKADGSYEVVFNVAGAEKMGIYISFRSTASTFVSSFMNYALSEYTNSSWYWSSVSEGKATFTFKTTYDYIFYSACRVEDLAVKSMSEVGEPIQISASITSDETQTTQPEA